MINVDTLTVEGTIHADGSGSIPTKPSNADLAVFGALGTRVEPSDAPSTSGTAPADADADADANTAEAADADAGGEADAQEETPADAGGDGGDAGGDANAEAGGDADDAAQPKPTFTNAKAVNPVASDGELVYMAAATPAAAEDASDEAKAAVAKHPVSVFVFNPADEMAHVTTVPLSGRWAPRVCVCVCVCLCVCVCMCVCVCVCVCAFRKFGQCC